MKSVQVQLNQTLQMCLLFGQVFGICDYLAVEKVPCAKLHYDVEEKYEVTAIIDRHEWYYELLLSYEKSHAENNHPVVVQDSENDHDQPEEVQVP